MLHPPLAMQQQRLLSFLLLVNIATTCYLLLKIGSIHRDIETLKESVVALKAAARDAWELTTGTLPSKVKVFSTHLGALGDTAKRLWKEKDE